MLSHTMYLFKILAASFTIYFLSACGGGGADESSKLPVIKQEPTALTPIDLPVTTPYTLMDEISPKQMVAEMAIGINLGNTFDAPNEGDWALAAKKSYIFAFKEAGFKHVRIPVTWHEHTQLDTPYEIDCQLEAYSFRNKKSI